MHSDADPVRDWSERLARAMGAKLGFNVDRDNARLLLQLTQFAGPAHAKAFASFAVKQVAGAGVSGVAGNAQLFHVICVCVIEVMMMGCRG
jgi:hypothetical protein